MCHTFAHRLVCPWCEKGEVLSNASQQVVISVRCPRCGHVFLADLLGLKTERLAPAIFHFFKKFFNPDKGLPD